MNQTCSFLVVGVAAAFLASAGCEQKTPPPPSSSSSGQGLNNLASNPTSIPGKSAAMGKNAAAGIQHAQDAAANAANQITGEGKEFVIGGVKFNVPEGWKSVPPSSSMVKATYVIADAGNAQCTFSTAGGDVQSNLDRWRGQVTDASGNKVNGDVTEHTAGGFRVYLFKATGTFSSMSGGKQANTAFRGAIVQMPAESVFVKLTGPADKIGPAEQAWEQMVLGLSR